MTDVGVLLCAVQRVGTSSQVQSDALKEQAAYVWCQSFYFYSQEATTPLTYILFFKSKSTGYENAFLSKVGMKQVVQVLHPENMPPFKYSAPSLRNG